MICPHCSQWNPVRRPRCAFCGNDLEGGVDRTSSYGPASSPAPIDLSRLSGAPIVKEGGSPADIARALRISSIVVFVLIVAATLLYRMCVSWG